ncbi:MAG: hypothetical protein ABIQ56_05375 [Chitinophagaceae bacterium]
MNKIICILLFVNLFYLKSSSQKIINIVKIVSSGDYTNPIISPDGKRLLLTKSNFKGVYIYEIKSKKITEASNKVGSGYGYSWSPDSKMVYFKEKNQDDYVKNSFVKSYNLNSKIYKNHPEINHNYINQFVSAKNIDEVVVYTNPTSLKIEARKLNSAKSWIITNDEGSFYNAILSNDKKSVIVHKGADIYLYHANGSGLIRKLGTGIATSWSRDDNYILGFLDVSKDGHEISNSDLYFFNSRKNEVKKITNTSTVFEMYPSFANVKNRIIFSDEKSGSVFMADINF